MGRKRLKLLSMKEAAAYLKISYSAFARLRRRGHGPPYVMVGKSARFPKDLLDEWIRGNLNSGK